MSPSKTSNPTHSAVRQPPSPATQSRKTRPIKTSRRTTTPTFHRRHHHPIRPSRRGARRAPSFPSASSSSRLSSSPAAHAERGASPGPGPGPLFRLTGRQALASAAAYRRGVALAHNNRDHHGKGGKGGSDSGSDSVPPSAPAATPCGTLVLPDRSRRSIGVPTTMPPCRAEKGIEEEEDDNEEGKREEEEEDDDDVGLQVGDGGVNDSDVSFSPGSDDSRDVWVRIDRKFCDGVGMDIPCLRGFCSRRP